MIVQPITLRAALRFVGQHHRTHGTARGGRFALAALIENRCVGVVIAGRPVARMLDDGWTLEVTRCCTDGTRNACSFLYGAVVRVAGAMGYRRIVTYTLASELGASLRASGWRLDGTLPGRTWSRDARPRRSERQILESKQRWWATCAS